MYNGGSMLRSVIIGVLGIVLVGGLEFLPGAPHIEGIDIEIKEPVETVRELPHGELASASIKPIYCADYVKLYDWNHEVAYNVMMVESRNNARNLNDNPATGDYSVGCFQINLLGGNQTAKYKLAMSLGYTGGNTRDELREWLWNPANNTAVAYKMWKGQSWQPWSATTCKKVSCY